MAPQEVYAWPEGRIFLYPSGATSALLGYAEDISIAVNWQWEKSVAGKTGTFAARSQFHLAGLDVHADVGAFYSVSNMLMAAKSATAYNLKLEMIQSGLGNTATILLTSGVFTNVTLDGRDKDLFRHRLSIWAADFSAL